MLAAALGVDRTRDQQRDKQELRDRMQLRRAAVTDEQRLELSAELVSQFQSITKHRWPAADAIAIALYSAKSEEADPSPLAQLTSKLAYPRVAGAAQVDSGPDLTFHWATAASLALGRFGLLEPHVDAPLVGAGELDAIVLPGLAFDRQGGRLGWGGGYYDRAILQHPQALRVALAFSTQLVDAVPTEAWDMPVDFIITETGVIQCKPST